MACQNRVLYIEHPKFENKFFLRLFNLGFKIVNHTRTVKDAIAAIQSGILYDIIILDAMMHVSTEEIVTLTGGVAGKAFDVTIDCEAKKDKKRTAKYYLDNGFNAGIFLYYSYVIKYLPKAHVIVVTTRSSESMDVFLEKENLPYFHKLLNVSKEEGIMQARVIAEKAKELLA